MKKYLLAALVVLSASTFAANVTVYGGANLNGKLEFKDGETTKESTKLAYTAGVEANQAIFNSGNNKIEIGLGTKYDSTVTSKEKDEDTGENYKYFSALSIYADAKYSYKVNKALGIYVKGKVGYPLVMEGKAVKDFNDYLAGDAKLELNGKMYTGLEVGADVNNFTLGVSYDILKADEKFTGEFAQEATDFFGVSKDTYKTVALTVGYKFGK